jgi:hypothetical protein
MKHRRIYIFSGLVAALVLGLAGYFQGRPPDAIDKLVGDLSSTHGMWMNGYSGGIRLPETASTQQVVEAIFKKQQFDAGQTSKLVTSYKILQTRRVHIPNNSPPPDLWTRAFSVFGLERFAPSYGNVPTDLYTAVLVQTDLGEKIILLKSGDPWWYRYYDANRIYYAKPAV